MEIILVDDGSPDKCPDMCDAWARKDDRIRVIHKENGGLSDARNKGMKVASGSYIAFVDSDDYIAPEMYEILYKYMKRDHSDISVCGIELVFEDGRLPYRLTRMGQCVLNQTEAMRAIVEETWLKQPVWNKLYKVELVQDIFFPVGKIHEDVFWSYQVIARAKKVSVCDKLCYFYSQRKGSIMGENFSRKRLDATEAKLQRLYFLENKFPELVELGRKDLFLSCIYQGQQAVRGLKGSDRREVSRYLHSILKHETMPSLKTVGVAQYCWVCMARLFFVGTCRLRNFLRIGL